MDLLTSLYLLIQQGQKVQSAQHHARCLEYENKEDTAPQRPHCVQEDNRDVKKNIMIV